MGLNLAQRFEEFATKWPVRLRRVPHGIFTRRRLRLHGRSSPASKSRETRTGSLIVALVSLLLLVLSSTAQVPTTDEYRAKANFLAAFPNFVDWPASAFPSGQAPFLLCVVGDFSFGTSLAETTRAASVAGRRVEIRWTHKEQNLRTCQILFVSRSEEKRYGRIFKAIQGASVLTVGETPDFLAQGGAIDFLFEADKLQFEVNMSAANGARLRISSSMLALARRVIT